MRSSPFEMEFRHLNAASVLSPATSSFAIKELCPGLSAVVSRLFSHAFHDRSNFSRRR